MSNQTSHPSQLGRYRVDGIIGRGAMGVIYHAYDPEADRPVAIKTLPFDIITDEGQLETLEKNLMHEAKIASKLTHPNIVQIYDVQRTKGENLFFVVMEYVDGVNLSMRMKQGPLPLWELRLIMAQVCDALNFAHDQQVVHRDVKPGNILLTPDLTAKITDFGIAKVQRRATTILFNQTGKMVGTPSYMSPEQVTDSEVDRRSDIFSLGCIFYRILTSQKPFPGKTIVDTLVKIVREPPVPPSHYNPQLTPRIEAMILRCLEKEKPNRYQSTLELKAEIEDLLPEPPPEVGWSGDGATLVSAGDVVEQIRATIKQAAAGNPPVAVESSDGVEQALTRAEHYVQRRTYLAALREVRRVLEKSANHPRASQMLGEISSAMERN